MSERIVGHVSGYSISRVHPMSVEEAMKGMGRSREDVLDLFRYHFGSYEQYVEMCLNDPKQLADKIYEMGVSP